MINRPITLAVVLFFPLSACADREPLWTGTMYDSAGVTIVANPMQGLWPDLPPWQVREVLRIGAEGDADYEFGHISGVVESSDGRIFVLDRQAAQVKVYGSDGRYERSFGRAGSGPGEFDQGSAGPLLIGAGDTLFIPDVGNQRLNIFTLDGTSLGSFRIMFEQGVPRGWQTTDAGGLVNQVRPFSTFGQDSAEPDSMDLVILRASDGSITDTLLAFPSGRTVSRRDGLPQFSIFDPEPLWGISSTGEILLGYNSNYRITRYRADGTASQVITMPFQPDPVSQDDQDMILRSMERIYGQWGVPRQGIAAVLANVRFGDHFPSFAQIRGGPLGSVWVQRLRKLTDLSPEESENFDQLVEPILDGSSWQLDLGATEWEVFGEDGRYLGILSMPERFAPLAFKGSRWYGVWRNEFDVQHAMILEVVVPS